MTALDADPPRTLIDDLLAEQQQLTAVERFSRKHELGGVPAQQRYYRDLIPIRKPQTGEQYAFAVDLDACTGCKACVSACHSLNGLDEDEIWRDVGVIHGTAYQQTITTACHHCVEPACLEGCPVAAYEKDAETGIVRHLDDQCIGCQYCVLKCPYDVPKYSEKRGIVRKCDMCHHRLAADEAPACVQACPNGAIAIRIGTVEEMRNRSLPGTRLLPGAFDSSYTKPATSYTTRKTIPANTSSGDTHRLRLEHADWPLIGMLLLTQLAAGLFAAAVFAPARGVIAAVAFLLLNIGLGISVLHLGRPLGAWRAFLGLRTSWMSREIFAFGAFAGAGAAFTLLSNWPAMPILTAFAGCGTVLLGILGVFCSAMIYIDTRRVFWSAGPTFIKFFGTTLLLGAAGAAATLAWTPHVSATRTFAVLALLIRAALFVWEANELRRGLLNPAHPAHRSMATIWKLCRPLVWARLACFIVANIAMILAILGSGIPAALLATLAFLLTFASQTIERYFFFTAVIAPRMPGGIAA